MEEERAEYEVRRLRRCGQTLAPPAASGGGIDNGRPRPEDQAHLAGVAGFGREGSFAKRG